MPTNHAAWLQTRQAPQMVVDSAPYTSPDANELVIRTRAVAFNPVDWGIQALGILIDQYPAILGCDVAGEVVEVHPSVADTFSIGDRVLGMASPLRTKNGVFCYAAFQEYVILKVPYIAKIPQTLQFKDATVLPLGVNTASTCLFISACLGLRLPGTQAQPQQDDKGQQEKREALLVWGASSSVGSCGVQLATHAGYEVVGIASRKNHDLVKQLGAKECFDQADPALVDHVVRSLEGKYLVGAYDAISKDDTLASVCEILDRAGGRKLVAAVMPGAEAKATKGVKITTNFAVFDHFETTGDAKHLWTWLEKALQDDTFKCAPPADVVGHGLDHVQKAVDVLKQGVSAKKLVVTI